MAIYDGTVICTIIDPLFHQDTTISRDCQVKLTKIPPINYAYEGMRERAPDQANWRYGLDMHNNRKHRNETWGNTFFQHENMLDWLGVTIYVSRAKKTAGPIVVPEGDPLHPFSSGQSISQASVIAFLLCSKVLRS